MILTGSEISRQVSLGKISISPFDTGQLNPNSYNYRLGNSYVEFGIEDAFDSKDTVIEREKEIGPEGLLLMPNHLYLCNTVERIGSSSYVTSLIGRSSLGRLGVYLQISADLGHQGEVHQWTLEIRAVKPTRVYAGMLVGQVTFWSVMGEPKRSSGYYGKQDDPTVSKGIR
ncbi:dCTP deaminase [Arthrobacter polaris]|uniref:dCTP deaminase n=1 Tax=Arthrobacter polaris TaxID=2813727 RepID=UPI001F1E641E|nr:deoxycytidine deaminase [Arthrobacter polaris]UIK88963.1 deoxycytidine deaminase [Arthrobacter polaris]